MDKGGDSMKTYTVRIYPNKEQSELIDKTMGCTRFVHNYILSLRDKLYQESKTYLSKYDANKLLPSLKQEYEWLKEVDSIALQASSENLDKSFRMFFKGHNDKPKYKKKTNDKSYLTKCVSDNIRISGNIIVLPKLGTVKCKGASSIRGKIKTATVMKAKTGKYSVSIVTDFTPERLPSTGKTVGIDLGLNNFAVLSNGEAYESQRYLKKYLDQLAREQLLLSRKYEAAKRDGRKLSDSKNYQKQKIKVAKIHAKIANCRKDFNHKVSTEIIKNHDIICIETLKIKNMVKNHQLARSVSDVAWGQFIGMLEYKADWYGKRLVKIDQWYASTQICSNCEHSDGKKNLSIRKWECPNCGAEHDRDLNAAINIKKEGLRLLANQKI